MNLQITSFTNTLVSSRNTISLTKADLLQDKQAGLEILPQNENLQILKQKAL